MDSYLDLVYAIECTLCGLIYVGETKGQLRSRMNGHRFPINHGGNQLLYKHFNLPDHSILSVDTSSYMHSLLFRYLD